MNKSRLCLNGKVARILRKRKSSKIVFLTVRVVEKTYQVALTKERTMNFDIVRAIPTGSLIRLFGTWGTSERGTETFFADRVETVHVFSDSLPDKQRGLGDDRRHLVRTHDLAFNDKFFAYALQCADMTAVLRDVLRRWGFREFNTGVLQRVFEGGLAEPFRTQSNANRLTYYLSLTSELKLKRLIAAGAERVCEITQSFRNEGFSRVHSPEFTLLEAYGADMTYLDIMEMVEEMVRGAAERVSVPEVTYGIGNASFARVTYAEACRRILGNSEPSLAYLTQRFPGQFTVGMPLFTWIMKLLERVIGPTLVDPTFITELPAGLSPLVRRSAHNDRVTDRAFLFANGLFICDIYDDEHDPQRLERELRLQAERTGRDIDPELLQCVRLGAPPTAGVGLGVNRLHMLFRPDTLPNHIRETILFPLA